MAIEAHYDFTEGLTAQYLRENFNLSFQSFRNISLKIVSEISENKIRFEGGFAFYKEGENEYLMFHYKKHCFTFWGGVKRLPKFHPFNCKTLEEFSGFAFTNKMPVDIYSKDERRTYQSQNLSLCGNCSKEIFRSWWGSDRPWFESVLMFIEQQKFPTYKDDGYHSMWAQISEAYREKMEWKCENCSIDLSTPNDRQYLHTHHKNGNIKDNRTSNFKALCLLCHALEHQAKLIQGTGFYEVDAFVRKYRDKLSELETTKFQALMNSSAYQMPNP